MSSFWAFARVGASHVLAEPSNAGRPQAALVDILASARLLIEHVPGGAMTFVPSDGVLAPATNAEACVFALINIIAELV
jgi:hypothetical protein